jgi:hypothetical protein
MQGRLNRLCCACTTGLLEFDESSAAHSVQISVPIEDAGQCIGVLVMGLRNNK